ncbi:MAG: hypothetical protein ACE5E7_08825 [Anaerolineae bacterium]
MSDLSGSDAREEGVRLFQRGDYGKALAAFETAASQFAATGDEAGQAEALNNLGVVQRVRGDRKAAMHTFMVAAAIFARLGDVGRRGQVLGNLGDLYAANRERREAARCYSEAAALLAQAGDMERQSRVLRALSLLTLRQGRWLEAMVRMEESLTAAPRVSLMQRLFRRLLRFVLGMMGVS